MTVLFRDINEFLRRCKKEAEAKTLDDFLPPVPLIEVRGTILDRALDWIRDQDWFDKWNKRPYAEREETMRRLVTGAHRDYIELRREGEGEEVYVSDHLFETF